MWDLMLVQDRLDKLRFDRIFQFGNSDKLLVIVLRHFRLKINRRLRCSGYETSDIDIDPGPRLINLRGFHTAVGSVC